MRPISRARHWRAGHPLTHSGGRLLKHEVRDVIEAMQYVCSLDSTMEQEELKKVQRRERFGLPPSKQEQAKLDAEERAAAEKDILEKKKVLSATKKCL